MLDSNNQTVEKYTYDAYGTPTILSANNTQLSTSAIGNRFMYTGREWIGELGIYDYRHRYYLPSIGRFLQPDPLGFGGGDANLFRYCGNDPVNRSDPSGLITTIQRVLVDGAGVTPDGWDRTDPSGLAFLSNGGFQPSAGHTYSGQLHSVGPTGKINKHPNGTNIGQHPSGPGEATTDPVIMVLFPTEPGQDVLTGLQLSWWPSWLTLPHYAHAVDPETAAWTDKGRVPTLVAAGILAAPLLAPETGLYAASAAGGYVAAGWAATYNAVGYSAAVIAGTGMVAYQSVITHPEGINSATSFAYGFFDVPGPSGADPWEFAGFVTRKSLFGD